MCGIHCHILTAFLRQRHIVDRIFYSIIVSPSLRFERKFDVVMQHGHCYPLVHTFDDALSSSFHENVTVPHESQVPINRR